MMWSKFDQVRIIPKGTGYTIEIVYDKEVIKNNPKYQLYRHINVHEDIIISIDLGVENIAAITDNTLGKSAQYLLLRAIFLKKKINGIIKEWQN